LGSSTTPPERSGIKRKSVESELSSLTRQSAEDTERSRQIRKRFRSEQATDSGKVTSSVPQDIEMSDTSTHPSIRTPGMQMSENLTVEEWERALEIRTRIPDPGLTERQFRTQRSSSTVSAAQGSTTQAPDTQPIDRRRPYPRPINLDWNQSYGMSATFLMPVSTASQSQTSSFGYPSIGSSYSSEDIDQEEKDIDQSLFDDMRNDIKEEYELYDLDPTDGSEIIGSRLADKLTHLRMGLTPNWIKAQRIRLSQNQFKRDNETGRWFPPPQRSIEIPSDYQRRQLEPQEPRIPSQVSEPQTYIRPIRPRIKMRTYPGMPSRDVRTVQDIYLNRQKWDKNLKKRQIFNTSQMRVGDHSIDKMRNLSFSRRSAMELEWDRYRRQQQVRQNAIIKPTVKGLPNQLEPIFESSEDESDNQTDPSDEEDDDFFYGLN
jgi:hypothetical protein